MRSKDEIKQDLAQILKRMDKLTSEIEAIGPYSHPDEANALLAEIAECQSKYLDITAELTIAASPSAQMILCLKKEIWDSMDADVKFEDNLIGQCASCGEEIVYRPTVPKHLLKICIECMGQTLGTVRH